MTVTRTRIAPSPTGDPHVGTAYIALFNLCFARQQGGSFILRIEDTDQARSRAHSEQDILASLQWLGLNWDEGPDIGGNYGPYRQSERADIYREQVQVLLQKGKAFPCFCSAERLQAVRDQQLRDKQTPGYDGHCLHLDRIEVETRQAKGEAHVIRMTVPQEGECCFQDMLRGEITIAWQQIDMQVLMKSDGLPTYHLANVVDDHLMQISHVIRGEEWINSTPKHLLLYQHFDWEPPRFCHMPLLRNPDKSKLSKRKNPTSINYYRDMGYLPEAIVNYLGMMGWTMPDGREKFTLAQMIADFDLSRVSLGGPVFDVAKLDWLNGKYIREDLDTEAFMSAFSKWAFNPEKMQQIVPLIKDRIERFCDVEPLAGFFLAGIVPLRQEQFEHKLLQSGDQIRILQHVLWQLEQLESWEKPDIEKMCQHLAAVMSFKIRDFLFPLFVAMSGKAVSTSVTDAMAILGLDVVRARLRHAIDILGGVSKKELKQLERESREFATFADASEPKEASVKIDRPAGGA
ncbi:MAG: glutamate--tRNA ligase [Pseudomonadales bacterium]|nr:glutamate--tRNA ligase [Pseudomonadales bacterium]